MSLPSRTDSTRMKKSTVRIDGEAEVGCGGGAGGMIFPDRATLYVTAIEDRQYKNEKINCTSQMMRVTREQTLRSLSFSRI